LAVLVVGHHPELTVKKAFKIFQRHFNKYEVYKTAILNRHFVVAKSGWVGVGVGLKQEEGKTSFIFTYMIPSVLLNRLIMATVFLGFIWPLVISLILRPRHKRMENEIKSFIENSPEFK